VILIAESFLIVWSVNIHFKFRLKVNVGTLESETTFLLCDDVVRAIARDTCKTLMSLVMIYNIQCLIVISHGIQRCVVIPLSFVQFVLLMCSVKVPVYNPLSLMIYLVIHCFSKLLRD
jgi:hypothetical protein